MKKCFAVTLAIQLVAVGCHGQLPPPERAIGSETRIAVGDAPNSVEIADFNRDGKLDLVVANNGSNNVRSHDHAWRRHGRVQGYGWFAVSDR
jgi:hypothetical protein